MSDKILSKADLAMFTGTGNWYRHPLVRKVLYTDGVKYVAETAGAYWLIHEIAFAQYVNAIAKVSFQAWKLEVDLQNSTAVLECSDGNCNHVYFKSIEYTDFPLDEISFYVIDNVILLPSEY